MMLAVERSVATVAVAAAVLVVVVTATPVLLLGESSIEIVAFSRL